MTTTNTKRLEAMYRKAGLAVEIEAGQVGLVVYGPSPATVDEAARRLADVARLRAPAVVIDTMPQDTDEGPATQWSAIVRFDWAAF